MTSYFNDTVEVNDVKDEEELLIFSNFVDQPRLTLPVESVCSSYLAKERTEKNSRLIVDAVFYFFLLPKKDKVVEEFSTSFRKDQKPNISPISPELVESRMSDPDQEEVSGNH